MTSAEDKRIIWCRDGGNFTKEAVYLKCIVYKMKNACRSFKFHKALSSVVRCLTTHGLLLKSNQKAPDRVTRMSEEDVQEVVRKCEFAAKESMLEIRMGDGYLPNLLAAVTCLATIRSLIVKSGDALDLPPKPATLQAEDTGEVVKSAPEQEPCQMGALFDELMPKKRAIREASSSSEEEEEVIVLKKRRK
ncbi:Oidioi.mRNA.OKI2018_I69.PAR.g11511.t1.cds [Oikopleura dioica]|uniref:Oidioi.mRNA.OKI2018_I69.PAR.g11511.t1.cds n=1 Tax=Oikopleura dioica TaxID=34765 RepID=A0ABN7RZ20_OIKDI|nr:Oidioi.mRNA.OKI2018_I69.PAR.g11511.t1.cds [Oikopleura dioica]